jgi:sugar O-acyltransferase (sialic acid O-acetyltransferase NeuD family)
MSKKRLVLFPFNGNALEALDCINEDDYEVVGFIDDDPLKRSDKYRHFTREVLADETLFVLAVPGSPESFPKREKIINSLGINKNRFVTIIHPGAHIGKSVTIGYNCLIMGGVVITSNAVIGDHVCILPNSVIHHDSTVGDFALVGTNVNVAGHVDIGRNCYIGSGSNIKNNISIGDKALVGIGSNVIAAVPPGVMVAGNPARILH